MLIINTLGPAAGLLARVLRRLATLCHRAAAAIRAAADR